MTREPRFPGIEWYCDKCNACLSTQKGFDDHKYTWKCKKCGYKNSISIDNINPGDTSATKAFLHLLGFQSFVGFWTTLMLGICIYVLHVDEDIYFSPFLIFLGIYAASFIITIILQFTLRGKKKTVKKVIAEILYTLWEDISAPFNALKGLLSNLLSFLATLLHIKRKYGGNNNLKIVMFNVLYVVLTIVEVIAFNYINNFTMSDWWTLIQSGYVKVAELVISLF